jgi:hypothetical protein
MRRGFGSWALVCVACSVSCSGANVNPLQGSGSDGSVEDTGNGGSDTGVVDSSGMDVMALDAGKDVVEPPKDSGPPKSSIGCGNSKCTSPDETCCRTGTFQQYVYQCTMPNGCNGGLSIVCDKRQNCESMGMPGTVCCGHYMFNGQSAVVNQVDCTQPSNCTQNNNAVVLCDPNDPTQCLQGQTCTLSTVTIPNYYFCK